MSKAKDLDIATQPLSKTFPEPDYAKLIESGKSTYIVSAVRAMRDTIPTKPRGKYSRGRLARYVEQVENLRAFAEDLLSGRLKEAKYKQQLEKISSLKPIIDAIGLYETAGHGMSLKGVTVGKKHYSVYKGDKSGLTRWEVNRKSKGSAFGNMPFILGKGKTKAEAISDFLGNYESIKASGKGPKKVKFDIYSYKKTLANGGLVRKLDAIISI